MHGSGQHRSVGPAQQRLNAACGLHWSAARLGVREATGRNDGPEVESYLRVTGNRRGDPWCGAFQAAGQQACGLPMPAGAGGARNWFALTPRTYYVRGIRGVPDSARLGHKVAFYYANLGRIGHVGQIAAIGRGVRRGRPARGFVVRAGNTGVGGGRDGAGVHDLFYSAADVYALSNWNY
ncbi:MAG: hypothetical protein ACRYG7_46235 [Janthinobacterium lividum]